MRLYMWVSKDKYQLPLFVSEKVEEVARVSGRNINTVYSSISTGIPCRVAKDLK